MKFGTLSLKLFINKMPKSYVNLYRYRSKQESLVGGFMYCTQYQVIEEYDYCYTVSSK